jgi:hypothetical protein
MTASATRKPAVSAPGQSRDWWQQWIVDATMGVRGGLFCMCPVETDGDGQITAVITGMNMLSPSPPPHGKLIAVVHEDGQEAVEAFCAEHHDALEQLFGRKLT